MDELLVVLSLFDPTIVMALDSLSSDLPGQIAGVTPDVKSALKHLTEQIEADPRNAEAYFRRGATYQILGWHPEAYRDSCECLRLEPDHARAWLILSEVLPHFKHYDQARAARQRALEIDPTVAG